MKVYKVTIRYAKGLETRTRFLAKSERHARQMAVESCTLITPEKITVHRDKNDKFVSA